MLEFWFTFLAGGRALLNISLGASTGVCIQGDWTSRTRKAFKPHLLFLRKSCNCRVSMQNKAASSSCTEFKEIVRPWQFKNRLWLGGGLTLVTCVLTVTLYLPVASTESSVPIASYASHPLYSSVQRFYTEYLPFAEHQARTPLTCGLYAVMQFVFQGLVCPVWCSVFFAWQLN